MVSANLRYRNVVPWNYFAVECSSISFNGNENLVIMCPEQIFKNNCYSYFPSSIQRTITWVYYDLHGIFTSYSSASNYTTLFLNIVKCKGDAALLI